MRTMKIEFDVGDTEHSQPVTLTAENVSTGKWLYTLTKHASNQRDETDTIRSLPLDVMQQIAKAVEATERFGK